MRFEVALCAEAVVTEKQYPTLNLELAPRTDGRVDWERKFIIQLSKKELPLLGALLMGYRQECHFKRPGKWIELQRQPVRCMSKAATGRSSRCPWLAATPSCCVASCSRNCAKAVFATTACCWAPCAAPVARKPWRRDYARSFQ